MNVEVIRIKGDFMLTNTMTFKYMISKLGDFPALLTLSGKSLGNSRSGKSQEILC
jgi:hypothetical protein